MLLSPSRLLIPLLLACVTAAHAQVPDTSLWVTDGAVYAAARIGGTLYIAGQFTRVGPHTGSAVPFDAVTGQPQLPFARVSGRVNVVIPDGAGGWYVGGKFTGVAGTPRQNLVRVLANGSVSPWSPDPDSEVFALARSGSTLYVGGRFEHIGGAARYKAGAVDVTSGVATAFDPHPLAYYAGSWPLVYALAIGSGVVYVGGTFASIGGLARPALAAVDPITGVASTWDPQANISVVAIIVNGATLYVGGAFTTMGGQAHARLAEISAADGSATSWNPSADQSVTSLVEDANTLYVGGYFTTMNGVARSRLAAFDRGTGNLKAFDPGAQYSLPYPGPYVNSIALSGGVLYVAGWFDQLGGQPRRNLGAVDASSGAALAWNPQPNYAAAAVAVAGGTVFAGGGFSSVSGEPRTHLAALDLASGHLTPWAPTLNDRVVDMVTDGNAIWIGGYFTQVNGHARPYVARLDPVSGVVDSWNPNASNVVTCLALTPSRLYIGGYFASVMAVDPGTGAVIPWYPVTGGGPVNKIVPDVPGERVNVASQGGFWRFNANNSSTIWTMANDGASYTVTQLGGVVYVGGNFLHANGSPRTYLAALDAATGTLLPWAPEPNNIVYGLEQDGAHVYVSGSFTAIGGQSRMGLALFDPGNATPNAFDAHLDSGDYRALPIGGDLVLSGGFGSVSGFAAPGFGLLRNPPLGVGGGPSIAAELRLSAAPVPATISSRLTWTLPAAARVWLDVLDVQGRLVASPVRGEAQPAGEGSVTLDTRGWRPGVYLANLRAAGRSSTRRIVVSE
jgi:hypothetical protein